MSISQLYTTLDFNINIENLRNYYDDVKKTYGHLQWSWDRCKDTIVKQWVDEAYKDPANLLTYGYAIQSNLMDRSVPCPPWNISTLETTEYRNTELAFGLISKLQKIIPYGYRWSISIQPPGGKVGLHSDQEDEYTVWIPIYTDGVAITFVTPDKTIGLCLESNGKAYLLDTTVPHFTYNTSQQDRVTIIFRINQKYKDRILKHEI